jgi:hypothetical protein
MAELYTRSDWYYVRYVKPDKTRGKIALRIRAESRNKKRDAIVATTAIEDLVSARDLGHSLNEKTRVWLDDVRQGNVKLHERLVKHVTRCSSSREVHGRTAATSHSTGHCGMTFWMWSCSTRCWKRRC